MRFSSLARRFSQGKRSSSARHAGRRHGRRLWAEDAKWQQQTKPRTNSRAEIRYGRTLKAKRVSRYDLNTPPIPGVACLPLPSESQSLSLAEAQERIFSGYLQLQHVRRAEYGRTQRWMCSTTNCAPVLTRSVHNACRKQAHMDAVATSSHQITLKPALAGAATGSVKWKMLPRYCFSFVVGSTLIGVVTGIRRALRFRVVLRAECFSPPLFCVQCSRAVRVRFAMAFRFHSGAGRLISLCRVVQCTLA